tara:strand:+ start:5378 stop:6514 length:1137 start_codon:yes stop_codon:yes gene_type:complete
MNKSCKNNSNKSNLYLFLNPGETLKTWEDRGYLCREIKYYKKLKSVFPRVSWITYSKSEDSPIISNISSIKILSNKKNSPKKAYIKEIHNQISAYKNELCVLKTNQLASAFETLKISRKFNLPLVIRCGNFRNYWIHRQGIIEKVKVWLKLKIAIHYSKILMVPTIEEATFAKTLFKIKDEKIKIVPNFVNTEIFKPKSDMSKHRDICFVGSFKPAKNLTNLILSLESINGVKLTLIGDGPEKESLAILANSIGVEIEFLGRLENESLPQILNSSQYFAFPSLYEGNPKALLEAMACGLPVITTPVYGIKNIINHMQNGYLCKDTTSTSIRETIIAAMNSQELNKTISINARNTITKNYSIESVLKKEIGIYKELELI